MKTHRYKAMLHSTKVRDRMLAFDGNCRVMILLLLQLIFFYYDRFALGNGVFVLFCCLCGVGSLLLIRTHANCEFIDSIVICNLGGLNIIWCFVLLTEEKPT